MLQELTSQSGATPWAVASMVFFLVVYGVVLIAVYRSRADALQARARLALDDGDPHEHPRGDDDAANR